MDVPGPTALTDDERFLRRLVPLLRATGELFRAHLIRATEEHDLPPHLAMALRAIDPERPVPQVDLADRFACDPSNVSVIVDRLEAAGLAERRVSSMDRRKREVVLTERGTSLRTAFLASLAQVPADIHSLDHDDRQQLLELLERLLGFPPDPPEA